MVADLNAGSSCNIQQPIGIEGNLPGFTVDPIKLLSVVPGTVGILHVLPYPVATLHRTGQNASAGEHRLQRIATLAGGRLALRAHCIHGNGLLAGRQQHCIIGIGRQNRIRTHILPKQLPVGVRIQYLSKHIVERLALLHAGGIVLPHPAHCVREHQRCIHTAVLPPAPLEVQFVAGKIQGGFHQLVLLPPGTEQRIPGIVHTVLQEDPQRLGLGLAHKCRVFVAAAHRHVGTHRSKYPREQVRTIPGRGERRDSATAVACYHTVVRILRNQHGTAVRSLHTLHQRQYLGFQERRPFAVAAVELVAAVVSKRLAVGIHYGTGLHEDAYHHRQFAATDQIVDHYVGIVTYAVGAEEQARRGLAVVSFRHKHLDGPGCTRINLRILILLFQHHTSFRCGQGSVCRICRSGCIIKVWLSRGNVNARKRQGHNYQQ